MSSDDRLENLRSRLEEIAEELADLAHTSLRKAIDSGDPGAAARERLLGRARRSVLKAVVLLGNNPGGSEPDSES